MIRPVTVQPVAPLVPGHVRPPGEEVTVYPVIELEPCWTGAVQVTATVALPGTPVTDVGRPGTGSGVTELDAAEAGPVPTELVAVTVNVYGVPLARPDTMHCVDPVVAQVKPPGADVTV